jgi:hypothetical protein
MSGFNLENGENNFRILTLPPHLVRATTSRNLRHKRYSGHMDETKNAYKILAENFTEKQTTWETKVRHRWEDGLSRIEIIAILWHSPVQHFGTGLFILLKQLWEVSIVIT